MSETSINKGDDSHLALEWLQLDWFYSVRGNHEDHFIEEYDRDSKKGMANIKAKGGSWFLKLDKKKQKEFIDELRKMPIAIEVRTPNGKVRMLHRQCVCGRLG